MKRIEDLKQRFHIVTDEIKHITTHSRGTFKGLSIEQQNKIRILETNLRIIEWELLGAMSARIAASSSKTQLE